MQSGHVDADESIQLVEEKLKLGEMWVKQLLHVIYLYDLLQGLEGFLFISEH